VRSQVIPAQRTAAVWRSISGSSWRRHRVRPINISLLLVTLFNIILSQGTITVNCPGTATLIMPPQRHVSMQSQLTAGGPPSVTVMAPGIQGATVCGTHGIGVNTPSAAAVAAITVGLVGLEHMPNGWILTIGTLSITFAAGLPPARTRLTGSTCNGDGVTPKLHCSTEPSVACRDTSPLSFNSHAGTASCGVCKRSQRVSATKKLVRRWNGSNHHPTKRPTEMAPIC